MQKFVFLVCAMAALAASAETVEERKQKLFRERVEIMFQTEGLKRQVEAAMFDPTIKSEEIDAARVARDQARHAHLAVTMQIAEFERGEKDVPQELAEALEKAAEEFETANAAFRALVLEHPKVKPVTDELAKADARAEEIRVEYEALQKQQNKESSNDAN